MDILVSRLTFFSVNQVYISKIVLSDSFFVVVSGIYLEVAAEIREKPIRHYSDHNREPDAVLKSGFTHELACDFICTQHL